MINIKNITSLNVRIASQIEGASDKIIKEVINKKENTIYNTLVVSPPGRGKTTILRDLIKNISNGISEYKYKGQTVGVVDERGEIAATYKGMPQNDIGDRTDVIENICKPEGISILIRSMAPKVIACDEIYTKEDVLAIKQAFASGVKGVFTMHGKDMEDIKQNEYVNELIEKNIIEKIFFI